jgi:hypothetical protein
MLTAMKNIALLGVLFLAACSGSSTPSDEPVQGDGDSAKTDLVVTDRGQLCGVCVAHRIMPYAHGKCASCGGQTLTLVYKYCNACAKEKSCCQLCERTQE